MLRCSSLFAQLDYLYIQGNSILMGRNKIKQNPPRAYEIELNFSIFAFEYSRMCGFISHDGIPIIINLNRLRSFPCQNTLQA